MFSYRVVNKLYLQSQSTFSYGIHVKIELITNFFLKLLSEVYENEMKMLKSRSYAKQFFQHHGIPDHSV